MFILRKSERKRQAFAVFLFFSSSLLLYALAFAGFFFAGFFFAGISVNSLFLLSAVILHLQLAHMMSLTGSLPSTPSTFPKNRT